METVALDEEGVVNNVTGSKENEKFLDSVASPRTVSNS